MRVTSDVKIIVEVQITDTEAEIINWLTDYSLAEWFATKANTRIPAPKIHDTLKDLRAVTQRIVEARNKAIEITQGIRQKE